MAMVRISCLAVATLDGMLEDNYRRALRLAEIALRSEPDILLLPEAFAAGYCATDLSPYAEDPQTSPWHKAFRDLSRRGNCMVVFGYIEKCQPDAQGRTLRNAVGLLDRGQTVGTHYKFSLWPDKNIAFRDEPAMMQPGAKIDIFPTRLGKIAVLTCYENWLAENWAAAAAGGAALILAPYNAPGDTTDRQVRGVAQIARPTAWANRTGTVHWPANEKPNGVMPNPGTAGVLDGGGKLLARSDPGVEAIVTADVAVG